LLDRFCPSASSEVSETEGTPVLCIEGEYDWSERRRLYSSKHILRFECLKCRAWRYRHNWQKIITAYPHQKDLPKAEWDHVEQERLKKESLGFNGPLKSKTFSGGNVVAKPDLNNYDTRPLNFGELAKQDRIKKNGYIPIR
jgi:hypothetical protein